MDPAKVALLFGHAPSWADPDDPEDRAKLLAELPDRHGEDWLGRSMVLEVVASHIADEDPPQVWRAAERLLADGMDRADVLWQLVLALSRPLLTALAEETELDRHAYVAALARLPVPSGEDIANAVIGTVVSHQPLAVDDLDRLVSEQLGTQDGDPLIGMMIDNLMDGDGPIAILAGDLLVHVESFTAGIVLTHRLSEAEQDTDILATGVDLSGFNHRWQLRLPGGEEVERVESDAPGWVGPPGWLREFPAGALLAVRIDDGTVRLAAVDQQPVNSGELVDLLRAAYDAEVEEPWLPVDAEELVLGMLVRQPRAFAEPAAPLTELAMAAGLEGRGKSFAHEESVWESDRSARRDWRVLHRMGPWSNAATAIRVLNLLDDDVLDAAAAREVLAGLYEPDVLDVVPDELLGVHDDPELLARTGALADRLLAVASRPREQAAAHWLAALVAERRREVREAESHVRMAVHADPGWGPALDRLAWYESDRGDAAAALTRWRQCGLTAEDSDDVRTVAPFAADPGPKLGRNQPCWCGSGRKFKVCHLGRPALASLPDRVGWLCRKATGYLERRGGAAPLVTIEHVTARAVDPEDPESLQEACRDPLVIDVVLHEDGWFEEFLSDRGALLPEDEVMLARTWTLVARTVYEVLEVSTGRGLTLRDLRTGDRIEVRERSFSRQARPGTLVCGRAVPDGESHQFVGGLFGVAPGSERELLDLLDEGDGMALLEYVAELHRPPQLVSADGVALR